MRVQIFDIRADSVHVEYYDADFRLTKSFFVPKLMPDYGGFYHASDGYYYLITGDSKTTRAGESVKFDIAKYSTDWKLLAHVQTTGDDVTEAFYAGTVRCADAVLLQQWLLNIPDTELKDWKAADFSADNRLDAHDLSVMKNALMK